MTGGEGSTMGTTVQVHGSSSERTGLVLTGEARDTRQGFSLQRTRPGFWKQLVDHSLDKMVRY